MSRPVNDTADSTRRPPSSMFVWLALLVALASVVGTVWLSIGLGLKPCPLCYYQRMLAMSIFGVLATGILLPRQDQENLHVLAWPLVVAGIAIAGFHVSLELRGKLECPPGILDVGTAPQQSLAVFVILGILVAAGIIQRTRAGRHSWSPVIAATLVGALIAAAAIMSAPPMPAPPEKPYETPLDMCRPPYQP